VAEEYRRKLNVRSPGRLYADRQFVWGHQQKVVLSQVAFLESGSAHSG